jgi:methylmalonyl-CoA mutase N-terminal domain/subunit
MAAEIALRTQQVIMEETGVVNVADPLGGSWYVEALTDQIEADAWLYLQKIDGMGGSVAAIEAGYLQDEIEQAAYAYTKAIDDREKVIVGVNKFVDDEPEPVEVFPIDPDLQRGQAERVRTLKAERPDQDGVRAALADLEAAARGTQNLLVPMKEALRRKATLGEVSDVLREVFGVYQPSR